jgi:hypothetical protein
MSFDGMNGIDGMVGELRDVLLMHPVHLVNPVCVS